MSHFDGGPPGGHHPAPVHHDPPQLGHESSEVAAIIDSIKGNTVKIFSKVDTGFNLGVKGQEVVVVRANDSDPFQQWIKDESRSNTARDSAGYQAFALINKGTGKALKHPSLVEEKVSLAEYSATSLKVDTLWSVGKDEGGGWHAIRSISNIGLNLDIDHGGKKYGPIKEGQSVIVFKWKDEENQHWKIENISLGGTTSGDHHHHLLHHHHGQ